jgi:hypothetical protein
MTALLDVSHARTALGAFVLSSVVLAGCGVSAGDNANGSLENSEFARVPATPTIISDAGPATEVPGLDDSYCPDPTEPETIELCRRLDGPEALAHQVSLAYVPKLETDCRILDMVAGRRDGALYYNEVVHFSLDLWGCPERAAPAFALQVDSMALSKGDASVLIELYLEAAEERLALSSAEKLALQRELERLALAVVFSCTDELSYSTCED